MRMFTPLSSFSFSEARDVPPIKIPCLCQKKKRKRRRTKGYRVSVTVLT